MNQMLMASPQGLVTCGQQLHPTPLLTKLENYPPGDQGPKLRLDMGVGAYHPLSVEFMVLYFLVESKIWLLTLWKTIVLNKNKKNKFVYPPYLGVQSVENL